jgi:hypothetical protein
MANRTLQRRRAPVGAPGMAGWLGLPERDRRLIEWLWTGDVVTAELAALLAYGNLRVAQRRLARLGEYGLVRGFWSANRQRPRGRYGYARPCPSTTPCDRTPSPSCAAGRRPPSSSWSATWAPSATRS